MKRRGQIQENKEKEEKKLRGKVKGRRKGKGKEGPQVKKKKKCQE